jgi:all-trans-retinol dehydrogenase (NAD+)
MRVAGSRVLVTGAGQGLGLAIAVAFVRAGARVILTDVNPERVTQAHERFGRDRAVVHGYELDVTAPDQVEALCARLNAEVGPIDVLINNAGVVFGGPFLEVPLDRHLTTIAVNLSGVLTVTHAFLPDLIARPEGHIVNIASAAAVIALPMGASYAASKWAVLGFSDSLREELRELGHRHVGVTAICPSYIATGLFDGAKPARMTRWLTPEEVAAAVVRAVERDQEIVMLPRSVRTMYRLCSGWPRSWYRAICRALGISRSMAEWKGHPPPGKGGATPGPGIR